MLVAAAFAPHPPLLVPEVAAGAAGELDDLRTACDQAVRRMLAAGPDRVVLLGAGPAVARWAEGESGSFTGFGVGITVPLAPTSRHALAAGPPRMPLSVTVGSWLLERAGYLGPRYAVTVPATATDPDLAGWSRIVDGGGRLGLLVMGDGSARRSATAPGYLDPRAASHDAVVARALRDGDPAGLRSLDPALGVDLQAAGVPAWRLAGQTATATRRFTADLLYDDAPYGVGYLVAAWQA